MPADSHSQKGLRWSPCEPVDVAGDTVVGVRILMCLNRGVGRCGLGVDAGIGCESVGWYWQDATVAV